MRRSLQSLAFLALLIPAPTGLLEGAGAALAVETPPQRTNPRHMSRAPEQPNWRMKPVSLPQSTLYENAPRRGLLLQDKRTLGDITSVEKDATQACRDGTFRRFGGGYVHLGGGTYRAARAIDIRRPKGFQVQAGIYVFLYEDSTRCTVRFAVNK